MEVMLNGNMCITLQRFSRELLQIVREFDAIKAMLLLNNQEVRCFGYDEFNLELMRKGQKIDPV